MKFIEVSPGVSINVESIDIITKYSETETAIEIGEEKYVTQIPYETFKKLLVRQFSQQQDMAKNIEQLARYQGTPTP